MLITQLNSVNQCQCVAYGQMDDFEQTAPIVVVS